MLLLVMLLHVSYRRIYYLQALLAPKGSLGIQDLLGSLTALLGLKVFNLTLVILISLTPSIIISLLTLLLVWSILERRPSFRILLSLLIELRTSAVLKVWRLYTPISSYIYMVKLSNGIPYSLSTQRNSF